MNDAFDFRDIVSFCFVVDSHPCLHLFRFERLRLCWCKVRQLSGGGLRCVFVDTVHSSRLCLKDGTIVSFFVSSLTDDIFVLKYSAYIQTSTSPPPLQWPPVLVGNHKEKSWLNQHKYWQSNLCEARWKIELQQTVFISDSMFVNITKMIGLRSINLEKSKITDIGVQSMSGRRIVIHARCERMAWRN